MNINNVERDKYLVGQVVRTSYKDRLGHYGVIKEVQDNHIVVSFGISIGGKSISFYSLDTTWLEVIHDPRDEGD